MKRIAYVLEIVLDSAKKDKVEIFCPLALELLKLLFLLLQLQLLKIKFLQNKFVIFMNILFTLQFIFINLLSYHCMLLHSHVYEKAGLPCNIVNICANDKQINKTRITKNYIPMT